MSLFAIPIYHKYFIRCDPSASPRLPLAYANISCITLFFQSLYYLGNQQITLKKDYFHGRVLAQVEATPFLNNKLLYACWVGLKVGLQTSWFLSWRVGLCVNAVGLFIEFKKYRVKREDWYFPAFFLPPLPEQLTRDVSSAPVAYRNYLNCAQDPKSQRDFFLNLSREERGDFCRWFAQNSPAEVTTFLKFDLEHNILDNPFHVELLDAIAFKNEDPFLCCFEPATLANWREKHTCDRTDQMQIALLKTLSVSARSKQGPEPSGNLVLTEDHLPALQQIFPYLANNDRANVARCCQLFLRVVRDRRHVPTIQSAIGNKLVWLVSFKKRPVDEFSMGQIEILLKVAHRRGILEEILQFLYPPRKDIEVWKRAGEICLSLGVTSKSQFVKSYQIYIAWLKGEIRQKESAFDTYSYNIVFGASAGSVLDPLAIWILEQGSAKDKSLICQYYTNLYAWSGTNAFLFAMRLINLMNYYLKQSPQAFQSCFLVHFKKEMEKQAAQFDEESVKNAWRQQDDPRLAWEDYLSSRVSPHLYDNKIFKSVENKLKKLENNITCNLFITFLASFYFPKEG